MIRICRFGDRESQNSFGKRAHGNLKNYRIFCVINDSFLDSRHLILDSRHLILDSRHLSLDSRHLVCVEKD